MSDREPITGQEIMARAVSNLEAAAHAAEAGQMPTEDLDKVYDLTMRTIAEVAFGACDYPTYCKFYGENPSFCDRSCDIDVWDQI